MVWQYTESIFHICVSKFVLITTTMVLLLALPGNSGYIQCGPSKILVTSCDKMKRRLRTSLINNAIIKHGLKIGRVEKYSS